MTRCRRRGGPEGGAGERAQAFRGRDRETGSAGGAAGGRSGLRHWRRVSRKGYAVRRSQGGLKGDRSAVSRGASPALHSPSENGKRVKARSGRLKPPEDLA